MVRRNKMIHEGPMLDLMIDYAKLAPRIIEGAMAEVLNLSGTQLALDVATVDASASGEDL